MHNCINGRLDTSFSINVMDNEDSKTNLLNSNICRQKSLDLIVLAFVPRSLPVSREKKTLLSCWVFDGSIRADKLRKTVTLL